MQTSLSLAHEARLIYILVFHLHKINYIQLKRLAT